MWVSLSGGLVSSAEYEPADEAGNNAMWCTREKKEGGAPKMADAGQCT